LEGEKMKKDMKKIVLSLVMAFTLVISQFAYIPFVVNAEGDNNVNVTVRIETPSKTILPKTNVSVTGQPAVALDAIVGALGDATKVKVSAQGFLDGIDGINKTDDYKKYWSFILNNSPANLGVTSQTLNEGDDIVLYFIEDSSNLDYKYSYFDREYVSVIGNNSAELILNDIGYNEKYEKVVSKVENANILIDGQKTDLFTNKEGKVTIPSERFPENREYIITAEKIANKINNISRPFCKIKVEDKDTEPPTINTQLKNKTVYSSKLNFDVTITDNVDEDITPIVKLNNEVINKNSDGKYSVTLIEGLNNISIYAKDSSNQENTKNITITYKQLSLEKYNLLEEMNLTTNYLKNNNVDEWSAISLSKLGIKGNEEYFEYVVDNFNKNVSKKGLSYYSNVELEKLIMYLTSQGYTPYNFNGYDLVKELFNRDINKFDAMDVMFGIFVYDYCNIKETNYKIKLNDLKDELIKKSFNDESGNLGWSLSGKAPIKPDLVGFAVLALSNWEDEPNVKTTIDKAVNTLSNTQTESGYYNDGFSGGESSEAVSVIILGLTSVGIDPTDAKLTKNGNNLISALMSFKGTNGQYKHIQDSGNDYMATEQALRALIALNEFYKSGKYNYYNSDINAKELAVYGKDNSENKEESTKNNTNKPKTNNNSSQEEHTATVVKSTDDKEEVLYGQDDEKLMKTTALNENKDIKEISTPDKAKMPITSGIITLATGAVAIGAYIMFRKDF